MIGAVADWDEEQMNDGNNSALLSCSLFRVYPSTPPSLLHSFLPIPYVSLCHNLLRQLCYFVCKLQKCLILSSQDLSESFILILAY